VLSPDGSRLVTANEEDTASLWDATDGKLVGTFSAHEGQVVAAVFSGDGKLVLSGSQDGTARLWDARTGGLVAVLKGHDATVLAVAFSKDGTRLATASEDKTVRIWSAAGEEVAALKGHQGPVVEVAFLGGRDELVTTSYDGTVRIWHVDRPLEGRIFEGRTSPLLAAFASHDGTRVLLVGSMDAPEIRDTSSGSVVARLLSAPFAIRSARFAEDGKTIMTLSWDGLLQIWSAATGEPLATLNRGEERFESAAFTNWERRIAALNSDHRVIVFPAPTEAEGVIDDARRRFSRCLSREERSELNIEATPPHWCQAELPPAPITSIE
jgi:WD40 repeat protein